MVRAATALAVLGGLVIATVPAGAAEARTPVQVHRQESLSLSSSQCTPLPRREQRCTEVELHATASTGLALVDLSIRTYVADPHGVQPGTFETGQATVARRLRVGGGLSARLRPTTVDLGSRRVVVSAVARPERPVVTHRERDRRSEGGCVVRTWSRERSANVVGTLTVDGVAHAAAVGRADSLVVRTQRRCS